MSTEQPSGRSTTTPRITVDDFVVAMKSPVSKTTPVCGQLIEGEDEVHCTSDARQLKLNRSVPWTHRVDPTSGLDYTQLAAREDRNDALHAQLGHDPDACAGVQLDCSKDVEPRADGDFTTALSTTAMSNWLVIFQLLLDDGADLRKDASKELVLHLAVSRGCTGVVKLIVKAAKEESTTIINNVNVDGMSPLFVAVLNGHLEIVLILLAAGADVTAQDKEGRSLLHCAVETGQSRIMQALFQHAQPQMALLVKHRCADKLQGTPLHLAISQGDVNSVKYLIEKCPEAINSVAYIKDHANGNVVIYCSLLHLVSASNNKNVLEYFTGELSKTPSLRSLIHETTSTGQTPLHFALLRKQHGYITALIAAGADLAAQCFDKDNRSRTAIDLFIHQVPSSVEVLNTIFDRSITTTRFTFSVVVDYHVFLSESTAKKGSSLRVLNALRKTGDKLGQNKLLEHPLVESYLFLLWKRLQGPYWVLVVLKGMLALSLSMLVLFDLLVKNMVLKYVLMSVIGFCMVPLALHEVDCFYSGKQPWKYRAESVMTLICFGLTVCACFLDTAKECAAFAILLSWFEVILMISRIPDTGFYMLMFIEVASKYLKLLAAFFFLIFGFVVAFLAIFAHEAPFHTFLSALLKTTVMMTNEFEYESLSLYKDSTKSLFSQISAMVVFMLFIIFMGLVLTNLFVAIAVIEIRKLHIIRKRIEFLEAYEKLLLSQTKAWSSYGTMRSLFRFCCILLRRVRPRWVESWEFYLQVKPSYKFRIQAEKPEFRFRFPERLNNSIIAKGYENKERRARLREEEDVARKKMAEELAKEAKDLEKETVMRELMREIVGVKNELRNLRTALLKVGPTGSDCK